MFSDDDHSNRSKWRRLLPHAMYTLSHSRADDDDEEKLDLVWRSAKALYSDGRYGDAEELQMQVMETRRRVLGDEHPDTLITMANLGRWQEAEELQVQAMQTRRKVLGDEHPSTLVSMANLASTYRNQGRWKEAFALMETCFQRRKQILGEQHPYTQSSLDTLNDWRKKSCKKYL